MKRRIALLLVICMLTTMLPPALAEEIVQIPNSADATLELPGDADGIVEDGLPALELGDVDPLQLDLGDLEQTDIEPENIPGEEGESGEADARDGGADNATAAGVPKTLTLGQKQTYAIDASKVSGGKTVTYKSSKATVATVSKKGVITAKKNGTAKITLTVGKKTVATCTVTVVNAPGNVTLPASSITLDVKATYQIKPKLPNKTMASFTYSSADKKIAKVSKEGLVTGLKVGSTTITVKTHNNKTAELSVTVKATEPTEAGKVTLSQTKATLSMGDTLQLTATLPKGTASVLTWTSDKPDVAKVNDFGLVTAVGAGTAKITVATANGKKASCTVTVNKAPGKVTVKPTAVTLAPGESIQLKATLPKGTTSELTWKSAKSAVAKVNENGLVTAVKAGTAKITVETNNGKKDTCVVTVKKNGGDDDAKAPKKVTLDQTKATLSAGDTLQLVATLPAGTVSSLTWTSDNTKVAKVNKNGLVTAVGAGTAKITVTTANKKKATCTLTVKKAPESVTLNAHELILGVGETFLLRTTLLPKGATSDLTWKSNKASVVKVNEDGMITAVKAGTAKITVETYNGKKDTCKVTVEKAALLRAYTDQASFSILPTNNAKLQVKTEVKRDPELTYKWYLGKTEITGATGTDYTVTADKVGSYAYKCVVSDGTNSQDVAFTVTVDNGLTAKASSAAEQTIYTKQETTLSVTAECSVGKPTYQWYEGDTVIDGATSASYAATKADAGDYTYKCVVSDGYGSTAEVGFTVTVKARTLTDATAQTASFSLKPGDKATLKVNVTTDGEPGLTYKWYLGENEITGANAASYAVTAGNVGSYAYKCVVTDDSAKKNSKTVSFTVTVANGLSAKASSATEQTVYTGKAATLTVTASASTNDKLSYQWYEGDTAISGATKASYAATKAAAGSYAYKCVVSDGYGSTAEVGFTVTVKEPTLTGATADEADVTVAPKGTATGATGASYAVTAGNVGEYTYKCQVSDGTNSKEVSFTVTVDNGFTARASSATEQTAFTGKAATLSVTASATVDDTLSYQWYEGDAAITGATADSYAATKADAGNYTYKCVVSDGYGSTAEVGFTVTVKEPTLTGATADEADVTVAPKGTAYEGESTQPIAGADTDSHDVTAGDVGKYAYRCVVTDDSTTQNSKTVDFRVSVDNAFAAQADGESALNIYTGATATMSVTASATVADKISYQWYAGETAIEGATAASYTTGTIADAGEHAYKCVVNDGYGSEEVTVGFTVTAKVPSLTEATAETARFALKPTDEATLKVNVTTDGQPTLTYTWFVDETKIDGETADSYALTADNVGEYTYKCQVSDGAKTSAVTFTVTVANAFAAQADGETTLNIYTGATATMSVTASATVADKISYQWYAEDAKIEDATAASYTTEAIAAAGEYAYKCVVGDGYGSEAVTVGFTVTAKVPSLTEATAETASFALKPTEQATLKVVTECDGEPTLSYTWFAGETKIDGETADSYAVTADNVGEYTYKCEVSDGTNTKEVPFTVTVDNAFSAQVKGEAAKTVFMGAAATLEVEAACATGDKLSYKWTRTDAPETVLGTEAAYTTDAFDTVGAYGYTCEIDDGYGSAAATLSFTVNVVNTPELTAATAVQAAFTVAPTGSATLEVQTECAGAPTLTYAWYAGEATDPIDGANEASYAVTVGNVGEYTYKCQVSDGTNTREVTFTVTVDNNLTAGASGDTELTVTIDEAAELAVEAGCTKGEPTYRWFEGESSEPIEGAESASYSVTKSEAGTYTYRCEVGDAYGSAAQSVAFTVTVTTPDLTVSVVGSEGSVTFAENGLDFTWEHLSGTFEWYGFRVHSESDFTVSVSSEWMTLFEENNYKAGERYTELTIDRNMTGTVRTGTVTFATQSTSCTVTISQEPFMVAELTSPSALVGKVKVSENERLESDVTLPYDSINFIWNTVTGATKYEIGLITPNYLMRDSDGYKPFATYTADSVGDTISAQVTKMMLEPGGTMAHRVFLYIYDQWGNKYRNYYDFNIVDEAITDWYYIYQREGDQITGVYIQGYRGTETEIEIPATINSHPVVAIDEYAFGNNNSITGVTIPTGITAIWNGAFSGCAALRSIVVPDSIETIRDNAFDGCTALKDIQVTEGTYAWNWFNDHGFFESEGILESDHPYESNSNETWTYTHPEAAEALEVTFSAKTELEDECDYLYISDANGDEKKYTGSELSGRTIAVMGNSFTIRLKSDGSVEEYGFKILSVTPATGLIDAWTDNPSIKVEPGNAVSMKVQVSYVGDVTLSYVWHDPNGAVIESAATSTCTVAEPKSGTYNCVVSDTNGNSKTVDFAVSMDNCLTAQAKNGNPFIMVLPGSNTTLEVEVQGIDLTNLTYQWQKWTETEDDDWSWMNLPGMNDATLPLENIQEQANYICVVQDRYGTSINVDFEVRLIEQSNIADLPLGETTNSEILNVSGVIYRIAADNPGFYRFTASNDYGYSMSGVLMDANWNIIATDRQWSTRVSLIRQLDAGNYYFTVCFEGEELTGTITACAEYMPIQKLELDTPATVSISKGGQSAYFSFTPEETGYYVFSSSADDEDTYGELYNANMQEIVDDDEGGEGSNFRIMQPLTAGTTYFFGARYYDSNRTGSFDVLLERVQGLISASTEQSDFTVAPETEVTMQVKTVCTEGETVSYQWFLDGESGPESIEGETQPAYTVTVTRTAQYRCEVSDTHGNMKTVQFWINVDNGLQARRVSPAVEDEEDDTIHANMGKAVALAVEASCNEGTPSYQWYEAGERIEGANSEAYTTKPIHRERTEVYCQVSDDYGNNRDVWFYIDCDNYVDNDLQVSAVSDYISVTPEETATLEASVTANDLTDATARWFYRPRTLNEQGEWDEGEWIALGEAETVEADGGEATLSRTLGEGELHSTNYRCEVSDKYGNTAAAEFSVAVDTGLSMTWDWENTQRSVPYGEPATLTSRIEKDWEPVTVEGLGYTWYKRNGDQFERIDGQTGASYTIPSVTWRDDYKCVAVDAYWNKYDRSDYVGVENELSVRAANGETIFAVPYGGQLTLAVEASCLAGQDALQYQWSGWKLPDADRVDFTEVTGGSYVIDAVTEDWAYSCDVTDIYGDTKNVEFSVTIIDPDEAQALTLGVPDSRHIDTDWAEGALYTYTPEDTGLYTFIEVGDEDNRWTPRYVAAYDSAMNKIDREEGQYEVSLTCLLTAGEKYYFKAGNCIRYPDYDLTVVLNKDNRSESATELALDTPANVNITEDGQTVYFSFTPEETGYYAFSSENDNGNATRGSLYDGNFRVIESKTGWNNFSLAHQLVQGNTYYYGAAFDNDDCQGSYTVKLARIQGLVDASTEQSNFAVAPNTQVTLQVNAVCTEGETLGYQWYRISDEDEALDGETGDSYTLTVVQYDRFMCIVTDAYGNSARVEFEVSVDNGLQARRVSPAVEDEEDDTIHANMGEAVALAVEASCNKGTPSYQWYEAYSEIEGANSAAYTTKPIRRERTEVYCHVSDDYGNTRDVWFYIDCDNYVDNNLQAWAVSDYISVTPEETATLEASVSANDLTDATAQWFYRPRTLNDHGDWDEGEWESLGEPEAVTAEGSQATVTRTLGDGELHTTDYRCEVNDKYGNTETAQLYVIVETGLSMTWDYEHSNFNVAPGAEATLTSQIQKDDEPTTIEGLDYTWYKRNGDDFEIISGQTGASYTIPTVTWRDDYKCVAVDAYWNKYDRSDYVGVENELSVRAANSETIFAVPYGGSVTLAVEASCLEGQDVLQYKWSGWKLPNEGNVEFTESTDSSYVIDSVTENWMYTCDVTDIYGNTRDVEFSVTIIDPNDATSLTANSPVTTVPESYWAEGILCSYTPQETGSYIFRVTGNSTGTPVYCALYSADMNKITRAEKQGDATLAVKLTGGEKYFFKAGYTIRYGGEDPFTVELISMSNTSALTLGEAVDVNLTEGGQIVCFSFTPVQTGRYVFESFTDGDSYEDTYGILYDGNMQEIANDDCTGENGHFKLVHELSADTTYYFATRYYYCDGMGAFSVRLTTEE